MQYSPNFNLNLPEQGDYFNVDDLNQNTSQIDDLLQKRIAISSIIQNTDLNTILASGIYYLPQTNTYQNMPASSTNGWLMVFSNAGSVKQIFFRRGSGSTHHEFYSRVLTAVYGSATTIFASNWARYATSKEIGTMSDLELDPQAADVVEALNDLYDFCQNNYLSKENPTGSGAASVNRSQGSTIGENSVAVGSGTSAVGENSVAVGTSTMANGDSSTAIGDNVVANGTAAIAMGYRSAANGTAAIATGHHTAAKGEAATAMGNITIADGNFSTTMGSGTHATTENSLAIGIYNDPQPNDLFEVGNGTDDNNRSNALTLDSTGKLTVAGDVITGNGNSVDTLSDSLANQIINKQVTFASGYTVVADSWFDDIYGLPTPTGRSVLNLYEGNSGKMYMFVKRNDGKILFDTGFTATANTIAYISGVIK